MTDPLKTDGARALRTDALRSVAPQVPTLADVEIVAARALRMVAVAPTSRDRRTRRRERSLLARPLVIAVAVALLLALLAAAAYAASLAITSARRPSATAARPRPAVPPPAVDAEPIATVSAPPTSSTPAKQGPPTTPKKTTGVTEAQAIATAGRVYGMDLADPPSGITVTARRVRFGDEREGTEGSVVEKDALVWIVTVDGLVIPGHGPARGTPLPPHTQTNIVIDAKTGAFLEEYSYK